MGAAVFKVLTDSDVEYAVLLGDMNTVYIYYMCSPNCVNCTFPKNCLTCENGYELMNGIC